MDWHTSVICLDPPPERDDAVIGLADLRKGLYSIVQGYLVCLGVVLAMAGLLWYVFHEVHSAGASQKAVESTSTVLFAGAGLLSLVSLFSLSLIVRGKWICLMNAPEHFHAKWLMFAAILCLLAGPALSVGSFFVEDSKQKTSRTSKRKVDLDTVLREIEDSKRDVTVLSTRGYIKLAGNAAGLLSSVFFVLFLRAVALCANDGGRARFAEFYLLFIGLLIGGVVMLLRNPAPFLARPGLLIGLAAGWLLCGIWYFLLIVNTIGCISNVLARQR